MPARPEPPRRRMPREQRARQLLDVAWALVGEEGTDALSLGRLAEAAGVTKPVAYDHFITRNGLLAALYQDYDQRQTAVFEARIGKARAQLKDRAHAIAGGYIDCVLSQGSEIQGILAALAGSPELMEVKRRYQQEFIAKCAEWVGGFATGSEVPDAGYWAILGAAESLSEAVAAGVVEHAVAEAELVRLIVSTIKRS
ncbi:MULTISPECIES: TetR/AcrR family transcriptional regulator [unclassified Stenotrophomonas]|uniref:TetR/AcrR family transcriptional regulator n=1 Tax=unclassified Stenotrophomonas TaxID=196198 RepID=UPI00160A9CA3|nr:TetR/AcrR family transcriptional regulator [Stenotrophomonas sp. SORGH_AS_0282]MDQ1061179.1 AcrR family transcriptional regulator [Stenotrophomonas sp. SORGH_AS_0282]MDQ1190472.1 AcrR family transcriptional regulator [Stenotrophomonas sp. SORGH_AS_0282]